ncbi:MAG: hypothetical protein NTU62_00520 [Spirochaetes bacterium]|nr:hypothetical protein [Spirochaetota bacterium]
MKHLLARVATSVAVLLVLASCASLQRMSDEKGAAWVAQQLNEGNAVELAAISSSPFLLDGEIIALPEDTAAFWNGLAKAGVKLDTELSQALAVVADTWREFGSTRDVQVFFGKYVADGARLFELPTANGRRVLVLCRSSWGSRKLYGFKGPF